MGMTQVHPPFIRKVVSLRSLGDTSFQRAFDGVAGQVVSAVEVAQIQKGFGLFQPDLRQLLEVFAIYPTADLPPGSPVT